LIALLQLYVTSMEELIITKVFNLYTVNSFFELQMYKPFLKQRWNLIFMMSNKFKVVIYYIYNVIGPTFGRVPSHLQYPTIYSPFIYRKDIQMRD
jgi:hypothetical protein